MEYFLVYKYLNWVLYFFSRFLYIFFIIVYRATFLIYMYTFIDAFRNWQIHFKDFLLNFIIAKNIQKLTKKKIYIMQQFRIEHLFLRQVFPCACLSNTGKRAMLHFPELLLSSAFNEVARTKDSKIWKDRRIFFFSNGLFALRILC